MGNMGTTTTQPVVTPPSTGMNMGNMGTTDPAPTARSIIDSFPRALRWRRPGSR